jgi:hypothetical protein
VNEQVPNTREKQESLRRLDASFRFDDDPIYQDEATERLVELLWPKTNPDIEKFTRI